VNIHRHGVDPRCLRQFNFLRPGACYASVLMLGSGKDPKARELHTGLQPAALKSISVKSIFGGVAICSAAAVVVCLLLNEGRETRLAAPAMCLLVVIVTTVYLGRLAGILGAAAASCVLAVFLYSPFGTLYVEEHAARTMLNLFLIGAVAVTLLVPRRSGRAAASKPRPRPVSDRVAPILKREDVE
jgi:K+-sensing histidine kinase KdpD